MTYNPTVTIRYTAVSVRVRLDSHGRAIIRVRLDGHGQVIMDDITISMHLHNIGGGQLGLLDNSGKTTRPPRQLSL